MKKIFNKIINTVNTEKENLIHKNDGTKFINGYKISKDGFKTKTYVNFNEMKDYKKNKEISDKSKEIEKMINKIDFNKIIYVDHNFNLSNFSFKNSKEVSIPKGFCKNKDDLKKYLLTIKSHFNSPSHTKIEIIKK